MFYHFRQERQLMWLPVCFNERQAPSEKGSNLLEKNLLPLEANSFLIESTPFLNYLHYGEVRGDEETFYGRHTSRNTSGSEEK